MKENTTTIGIYTDTSEVYVRHDFVDKESEEFLFDIPATGKLIYLLSKKCLTAIAYKIRNRFKN